MIDGERLLDLLCDLGFEADLVEDGTEICLPCPLCASEGKRLYVNAETGVWLCFRCSERGTLFDLFHQVIGLSVRESFEKRREARFRRGPKYRFKKEAPADASEVELPKEFIPFKDGPRGTTYTEYLYHRGILQPMRVEYGMGYCLTGFYSGRVIIPVYGKPRRTLYTFVARAVAPAAEARGKVLYPPHSRPGGTLFNLDHLHPGPVVLVEGVFDALRMPNMAVAVLGSQLSAAQMELLTELGGEWGPIVVCMDGDRAGRQASAAIMKQLWGNMLQAHEAVLPDGVDPADAPGEVLCGALEDAVSGLGVDNL